MEINRIITTVFDDANVTPKLRVGIETGHVVAGIVGRKKFSYDCKCRSTHSLLALLLHFSHILHYYSCFLMAHHSSGWSPTVRDAHILTTQGADGFAHVSQQVFDVLKHKFVFSKKGMFNFKSLATYLNLSF